MKKSSKNSGRWVLLNPGPVNATARVRKALLKPDICHREIEFSKLLESIREKLLKLFHIHDTHTAAFFSGSGTAALEAMLSSFALENKSVLVLSNGVYGERLKKILETHNTPVRVLSSGSGDFPKTQSIETFLKNDPSIHAVAMVHHETSTGMLNPVKTVGKLSKKYGKLFMVDAVSSLGAEKIDFKKFFIDACAGTSGKCLHGLPGVSFVILSKKAFMKLRDRKPKTFYLDLSNTLKHEEKNDTPFTPAVPIFYAFEEALNELIHEGLSHRIESYREKSELLEKGFIKMGLRFLVEKEHRSHVLTALWMPGSLSYEKLHEKLRHKGFIIYAGQSELKGKIFRVANLGDVQKKDLLKFLTALKKYVKS